MSVICTRDTVTNLMALKGMLCSTRKRNPNPPIVSPSKSLSVPKEHGILRKHRIYLSHDGYVTRKENLFLLQVGGVVPSAL